MNTFDIEPDKIGKRGAPSQTPSVTAAAAEIMTRELQLMEAKNRTQFLVSPRILLDFCDMDVFRNFDLFETQLVGEAYAEMLDRVAPEFIGEAAIHDVRVEACGDVGFASLFETYTGYARETRERIRLMIRISHGWKKKDGTWLLTHEHMSYPVDAATGTAIASAELP